MNDATVQPNIIAISPPSILCVSAENSILVTADTPHIQKVINSFLTHWPNKELYLYVVDTYTEESLHWIRLYSEYCSNKIVIISDEQPFTYHYSTLWANDSNTWLYRPQHNDEFDLLLTQHNKRFFDNLDAMVQQLVQSHTDRGK